MWLNQATLFKVQEESYHPFFLAILDAGEGFILLTLVIGPDSSFSTAVRLTLLFISEMFQQLLDGLP